MTKKEFKTLRVWHFYAPRLLIIMIFSATFFLVTPSLASKVKSKMSMRVNNTLHVVSFISKSVDSQANSKKSLVLDMQGMEYHAYKLGFLVGLNYIRPLLPSDTDMTLTEFLNRLRGLNSPKVIHLEQMQKYWADYSTLLLNQYGKLKELMSSLQNYASSQKPLLLINDLKSAAENHLSEKISEYTNQVLMGSFELGFLTGMGTYKGSFIGVVSEDKSVKPYKYDGNYPKFLRQMDQRWESEVASLLSRTGNEVNLFVEKFKEKEKK